MTIQPEAAVTDPAMIEVRRTAVEAAVRLHGAALVALDAEDGDPVRERGKVVGSVLRVAGLLTTWIVDGAIIPSATTRVDGLEVAVNGAHGAAASAVQHRVAAGRGPR